MTGLEARLNTKGGAGIWGRSLDLAERDTTSSKEAVEIEERQERQGRGKENL